MNDDLSFLSFTRLRSPVHVYSLVISHVNNLVCSSFNFLAGLRNVCIRQKDVVHVFKVNLSNFSNSNLLKLVLMFNSRGSCLNVVTNECLKCDNLYKWERLLVNFT